MSRLDYAPKLKEIEITDIKKGLGVFTPKPDKPVSFAALKETLKKAGYELASSDITIAGTLKGDAKGWWLVVESSGQRFALEGTKVTKLVGDAMSDTRVEISGEWRTVGSGTTAREVIIPTAITKTDATPKTIAPKPVSSYPSSSARFVTASFAPSDSVPLPAAVDKAEKPTAVVSPEPRAPIRVTSPGLTVYKGGAITPRLFFIHQHLGDLDVDRQMFQLSVSYTPTPRLQLEVEVPVSHTSFDDGVNEGAGTGLGNITLWSKYRFFRTVKTYGDRQAAVRFGLELPTGSKTAPTAAEINAPAFVRQQLTPINGGLSPHFDIAFSQAGGRLIFGGNVEGILRSERDGFRMGHEIRVNTDLEYVLLPRDYTKPGRELFLILETTFVQRGQGRINGEVVSGSKSTEYYVAPGLQYAAAPQFVIEGSVQLPLVRNTGALVLRTDRNILLGVRYLF